jgi:hypothetical protein
MFLSGRSQSAQARPSEGHHPAAVTASVRTMRQNLKVSDGACRARRTQAIPTSRLSNSARVSHQSRMMHGDDHDGANCQGHCPSDSK